MSIEFVNVPVPVDRVQEVYELLARPRGASPTEPFVPANSSRFDIPEARVVTRAYLESQQKMRSALDFMAANASREIPMTDLAEAVGYDRRQMSGMIGAFLRRWKNHYYGGQDTVRPFFAYWDSAKGMVIYAMAPEVAEAVRQAAALSR
jgi:hypothetical protein